MAKTIMDAYGVEEPAPHRGRIGSALLTVALIAAPAAWAIQLFVTYGLASHACFPRETPVRTLPDGGRLGAVLTAINLTALGVALLATLVSLFIWRRTREEMGGGHGRLLQMGEGRTRFFAVWGIWSGVWFAIQIAFGAIALLGAPGCGS